jgi:hypothetical protein
MNLLFYGLCIDKNGKQTVFFSQKEGPGCGKKERTKKVDKVLGVLLVFFSFSDHIWKTDLDWLIPPTDRIVILQFLSGGSINATRYWTISIIQT